MAIVLMGGYLARIVHGSARPWRALQTGEPRCNCLKLLFPNSCPVHTRLGCDKKKENGWKMNDNCM
jgi:hypothetical protein